MGSKRTLLQCIQIEVSRYKGKIEAIYVRLSQTAIVRSKELTPNGEIVIDLDKAGSVVGVEMLQPSSVRLHRTFRMPDLKKYPELRNVDLQMLPKVFA